MFVFILGVVSAFLTEKIQEKNRKIQKLVVNNFTFAMLACTWIWILYIVFELHDKTTTLDLNFSNEIISLLLIIFSLSFFVLFLHEVLYLYLGEIKFRRIPFIKRIRLTKFGFTKIMQLIYLFVLVFLIFIFNQYDRKDNYLRKDTLGYFYQSGSVKVILEKEDDQWKLRSSDNQNVRINSDEDSLILTDVQASSVLDDSIDFKVSKSEIIIPLDNFKDKQSVQFDVLLNRKIEVKIPKKTVFYFDYSKNFERQKLDFKYKSEDNQFLLLKDTMITLKKDTFLKLTANNNNEIYLWDRSNRHSTISFRPLDSDIQLIRDTDIYLIQDSAVMMQSEHSIIKQTQLAFIPVYFIALFYIIYDIVMVKKISGRRMRVVMALSKKNK